MIEIEARVRVLDAFKACRNARSPFAPLHTTEYIEKRGAEQLLQEAHARGLRDGLQRAREAVKNT